MTHLPYYTPDLDRSKAPDLSEANYGNVIELLGDQQLAQMIAGQVTLAIIRPEVGPDSNILGLDDIDCAWEVESSIKKLGILAKFSLQLTEEEVGEFYRGIPQSTMETKTADDPTAFDSRWPEFKLFMASGVVTVLLLHSPDGDAIEKFREQVGHWNIDKVRDEETIRGKFALNNSNNLVHGSDAPEAVTRELSIIRKYLQTARAKENA